MCSWWFDACSVGDLRAAGRFLCRLPSGRVVLILSSADAPDAPPLAMDAACYHHGGPLADGAIEDLGGATCVSCPWHKFRITLGSGEALYESLDLATRAVTVKSKGVKQRLHVARVHDGRVEVCDTAAAPGDGGALDALGATGFALWTAMRAAADAAGGAIESDKYAFQNNNSQTFVCAGDGPRAAGGGAVGGVTLPLQLPLHSSR